jgi:hypothetical protein
MGDQLLWYFLTLGTKRVNGVGEVWRRPGCDGGDQQVQAACSMHLVLLGAIAELAALTNEDGATRAVDGFTIVQFRVLADDEAADRARVRG